MSILPRLRVSGLASLIGRNTVRHRGLASIVILTFRNDRMDTLMRPGANDARLTGAVLIPTQ